MNMKVLGRIMVVAWLSVLAGCSCKAKPQEKIALKPPTGTPKRPQGMAALTVKPGPAPFTKEDVTAYFKTHKFPKNQGSADQVQVDNLEFITSGEVTKRLQGVSTGLGESERVAFATLSGPFVFTGPKTKPVRFQSGYAVFDAITGNLLMVGTLEQAKSDQPR
jgi:outer membrane murein-binding lipoprotein Lpp